MASFSPTVNAGKSLRVLLGTLCLLLMPGCGNSGGSDDPISGVPAESSGLSGCADTDSCLSNPTLQLDEDRPAQVRIPSNYTTTTRYPLIIVLHGFGANGEVQASYLGLDTRVDTRQYVLVYPDGLENLNGTRYWNATPACCAGPQEEFQVDDVAYIRGLIEKAAATYSIDTSRIGLIGHSNGGFMALRMACEASDLVTAVVSLAGSTFTEDSSCTPASTPVSVLTLHGDEDETIRYEGGIAFAPYPGAQETIRRFAGHAGCDASNPVMASNFDVVGNIDGSETTVLQYPDCAGGAEVMLWTMVSAPHVPFPWVASALDAMVEWTLNHPRD